MAISIDKFVRLLVKSNAVEPKRLKAWLTDNGLDTPIQATESTDRFPSSKYLARALIDDGLLTKWQAKFLLSGRHRLMIGSYLLLKRLGREDFGDRFVARHSSLDRKVDLQLLASDVSADAKRREDLIAKTSRVAELDHPHLVHVYDIDQVDDQYFLVVEHVDGTVLQPDAEFGKHELAQLTVDAIEALVYAHGHDVVHGAISAQDIILTESGIKIQNLTLEILRKSSTEDQPAPEDDFQAISSIGLAMLKSQREQQSSPPDAATLALELLLTRLRTEGAEALPDLKQWRLDYHDQIQSESTPAIDPDGNTETQPDSEQDSPVEDGWLSRRWRENPVNLIALALTMLLLVGGGTAYAIYLAVREPVQANSNENLNQPERKPKQPQLTPKQSKDPDRIEQQIRSELPLADGPAGKIEAAEEDDQRAQENSPDDLTAGNDQPAAVNSNDPSSASDASETDPCAAGPDEAVEVAVERPPNTDTDPAPEIPVANEGPDDLTEIKGIGDFWDDKLKENGISTFEKLASWTPEQLQEFSQANHSFGISADNCQSIIEQAKSRSEISGAVAGDPGTKATTETSAMGPETVADVTNPNEPTAAATPAKKVFDPAKPFENFPSAVSLPPVETTDEIKLSGLVINPLHKLQATIVSPEGVSRTRMFFELERKDQGQEQRWIAGVKRTERQDVTPIAMIRKSPDALYFRWLPEAEGNRYASNLVNCFVKLATPGGHATVFGLRTPAKVPAMVLDPVTLVGELEFKVDSLPDPDAVQIAIGPLDEKPDDVQLDILVPNVTTAANGRILLKDREENPTMWVEVTADIRGRMRVEAVVMLVVQGRARPVNARVLQALMRDLDRARLISEQQLIADANNDELKKRRGQIMSQLNLMNQYLKSLEHLAKQPIKLRALANFDGYQAILADSDPALNETEKQ